MPPTPPWERTPARGRSLWENALTAALTYKDAGVDFEAGNAFVNAIRKDVRRTYDQRVILLEDGFAGLCRLSADGLLMPRMRKPVLAACTDGVGTKLKIAFMMDKHDTVGVDLVAMSVNDLLAVGAQPLFFLDYIAAGRLQPEKMAQIVKGIADGCVQADCALLGGETAEMPDFYAENEYDLAGFAVGLVERNRIVDGRLIAPGDVAIGLASSGVHSNGYSLLRKVFFERARMSPDDHIAELGCTLGEALLRPTRIYARAVAAVLRHYKVHRAVHGVAHITGGGLADNILRLLPKRCQLRIHKKSWEKPPIFDFISRTGGIDPVEMFRVFNMGIGMVVIAPERNAHPIMRMLKRHGETARIIGEVRRGKRGVVLED